MQMGIELSDRAASSARVPSADYTVMDAPNDGVPMDFMRGSPTNRSFYQE